MSGPNNRRIKIVVAAYSFIIMIIVLLFLFYPKIYNYFEHRRQEQKIQEVEAVLKKGERLATRLSEVTRDSTLELLVLEKQQLVYESIPLQGRISEIQNIVKKENLVFQKTYQYKDYVIWIAFYPQKIQSQFNYIIGFMGFLITLLVLLIVLSVFYLYRQFLQPLTKLRESILALKKFNIDQAILITEYKEENGLLADLSAFSKELKKNIEDIGTKFTELEMQLQQEQDLHAYKKKLVNSLIHDLKTPLSIMIMSVELLLEDNAVPRPSKHRLAELLQRQKAMLKTINDILKASNSQVEIISNGQTDLIPIIRETLNNFQVLIKNKKLYCEISMPSQLELTISKIEAEQLVHNILTNVINYSPENKEFTIDINEENGELVLVVVNEVEESNDIDFTQVFDLFYHSNSKNNHFSTGLGMYTIAAIVQRNNGSCKFEPSNDGVCLTIHLPIQGDRR